jgi:hypothetical protein
MSDARSMISGDQYLGGLFVFFYRLMRQHWPFAILLPLVAMAAAYFAAQQLPPVYLAQGSIRLGRLDGAEAISLSGAASRMNSLSFKQRVVRSMNLSGAEGARPAQLIFGSLTVKQETPDTVAVSVRAPTDQQAREAVGIAVGLLNEEQRKTKEPLEADIKEQLAAGDATIANLLEARDSLAALAKEESKVAPGDPASATLRRVWLSDLVSRNEQRLAAARAERHGLATRLAAWRTYPTALVDEVFVSPSLAFAPPATVAIFIGVIIFLGFLLSAAVRESKVPAA